MGGGGTRAEFGTRIQYFGARKDTQRGETFLQKSTCLADMFACKVKDEHVWAKAAEGNSQEAN